jgi:catechol 2,3-dioxygenase-like lactoylglutathione lyase family enzyme
MAITGVANLAVKVRDLDSAIAFYRRAGAAVTDKEEWHDGWRADVHLGPLQITLFTRALYEDRTALPEEGFLHVALFSDDLDREVEGHRVIWGPDVVSGPTFGTRRIVFVEAPGGMRLEFMEQLAGPPDPPG